MKKSLLALVLAGVSSLALAGPYDGAYQAKNSTNYMVVLQNGSTLAIAVLSNTSNGPTVKWGGAQQGYVVPAQVGTWSVALGPINGNTATVTGTSDFGACTSTATLAFDGAGNVAVAQTASTPTALGLSSGYNCALGATGSGTLSKIF